MIRSTIKRLNRLYNDIHKRIQTMTTQFALWVEKYMQKATSETDALLKQALIELNKLYTALKADCLLAYAKWRKEWFGPMNRYSNTIITGMSTYSTVNSFLVVFPIAGAVLPFLASIPFVSWLLPNFIFTDYILYSLIGLASIAVGYWKFLEIGDRAQLDKTIQDNHNEIKRLNKVIDSLKSTPQEKPSAVSQAKQNSATKKPSQEQVLAQKLKKLMAELKATKADVRALQTNHHAEQASERGVASPVVTHRYPLRSHDKDSEHRACDKRTMTQQRTKPNSLTRH